MKSFRQHLMESARTYRYKIKVAGDPGKNWMDMFAANLQKFDPVKIGAAKSTPIQKDPYGFPGVQNQPIHIMDVEFRYPCTEPMVKQLARLLKYDENLVRMIQADYDESVNTEMKQYEEQMAHSPVLDHEQLEDAGKQASKEYGEQYLPRIRKQASERKMEIPFAGEKTKAAFDPLEPYLDDRSAGDKSPMTTIVRQAKPATGGTASRSK